MSIRVGLKPGYSLVEVLCVIAIIGILTSMLMPAVQSIRESARKTNCLNNLRQISLSAQIFESSHRRIPPGSLGFDSVIELDSETPSPSISWFDEMSPGYWKNNQHTSSLVHYLPFVEQESMSKNMPGIATNWRKNFLTFRTENSGPDWIGEIPSISEAMTKQISLFLCPSDDLELGSHSATAVVTSQPAYSFESEADILICEPIVDSLEIPAATNYLSCSGAHSGGRQPNPILDPYRGYGSCREKISIHSVKDGSSHTILYGENIGHIVNGRRAHYFAWMFGGLMRGRGVIPWMQDRHDLLPEFLLLGDSEFAFLSGFGSRHPDSVNVTMGDGSVRPISRLIDVHTFYSLTGGFDGNVVSD